MNIQAALQWGQQQLSDASETAYLDTLILLSTALQSSHTKLLTHPLQILTTAQNDQFQQWIKRRCVGEPIPYLVEQCEFWSLPFKVTPSCLIPRSETELLVEKILDYYPKESTICLADLGTGSGAIAIALATERPQWQIIATDYSEKAIEIAQYNAQQLGADNIQFRIGDWCNALDEKESFHGIISNPPYLSQSDPHLNQSIRYEPQTALIAEDNGLAALYTLIQQSRDYLLPNGCLWLEQGYNQANSVKTYFEYYQYSDIQQYKDLAGITRVTKGQYKG